MKHLANNMLRSKNMLALLQAMNFRLEDSELICLDEHVVLRPGLEKEATTLRTGLQDLLKLPSMRYPNLAELIIAMVREASSGSDMNKQGCLALLGVMQQTGLNASLDAEHESLNIALPSIAFASLFASLNYDHIHVENGQLRLDIRSFLKKHKKAIVCIEGVSPMFFIHTEAFAEQRVLYAQKRIDHDTIEVTPYFFVPNAITPPTYHFILDTSYSMNNMMGLLKKSACSLAQALFDFQPKAKIAVSHFNSGTYSLGTFEKDTLANLINTVNQLSATGRTRLFGTVFDKLNALPQSHNNILLFTDGSDDQGVVSKDECEKEIRTFLDSLKDKSPLLTARNKFFILSYCTEQPEILHEVTKAFSSPIIETKEIDFQTALSDQGKLQEWAAKKELFICRLTTRAKTGSESCEDDQVFACDMSGQFVALQPKICKDNDTLEIKILDGSDTVLLEDVRSFGIQSSVSSVVEQSIFQSNSVTQSSTDTLPVSNTR